MIDPDEILESASSDMTEARAKIDTTRKVLQAALDSQNGDHAVIRQTIARLDQIEAELDRVEGSISMPMATTPRAESHPATTRLYWAA